MEGSSRWALVTAVAPIAWGSNYWVTRHALPADFPLYGALIRALPAGLLLLALRPRLPRGAWWWRSLVLGAMNVGAFFALIYLAAQKLPTSIASTIMAASPVALMLMAWAIVAERPRLVPLTGAAIGIAGVAIMLLGGGGEIDPLGVAASVTAMLMSAAGYVLAKRWSGEVELLASTSWQLLAGGALLLIPAALLDGAPPALDFEATLGFAYVTVIATAVAFVAWFGGLSHLPASTVGLVGLLNPVTGVLLGTLLAGELLSWRQALGIALVLVGIFAGRAGSRTRPRRTSRVIGTPAASSQ